MASVKFNFDSKKFMRELERDIKHTVEKDIQQHPAKVLDNHVGNRIDAKCSHCGDTEVEVLSGGCVRCVKCGTVSKPDLNVRWR